MAQAAGDRSPAATPPQIKRSKTGEVTCMDVQTEIASQPTAENVETSVPETQPGLTPERVQQRQASFKAALQGTDASTSKEGFDDDWYEDYLDELEKEEEEEDDPRNPVIKISRELERKWSEPWQDALIVKLMGKTFPFAMMKYRLKQRWQIRNDFKVVDIGNGYFIVKFAQTSDLDFVLRGGPWTIAGHYLTMRRWRPDFEPERDSISRLAVWVRLPEVKVQYFNHEFLSMIGKRIGKVLKMDLHTEEVQRGRFARLCVEVDITKPLLAKYRVRRKQYRIEYEGVQLICFNCGYFGHRAENCPKKEDESREVNTYGVKLIPEKVDLPAHVTDDYGEWMTVHGPKKRNTQKKPVITPSPGDDSSALRKQLKEMELKLNEAEAKRKGKKAMWAPKEQQSSGSRFDVLNRVEPDTELRPRSFEQQNEGLEPTRHDDEDGRQEALMVVDEGLQDVGNGSAAHDTLELQVMDAGQRSVDRKQPGEIGIEDCVDEYMAQVAKVGNIAKQSDTDRSHANGVVNRTDAVTQSLDSTSRSPGPSRGSKRGGRSGVKFKDPIMTRKKESVGFLDSDQRTVHDNLRGPKGPSQ